MLFHIVWPLTPSEMTLCAHVHVYVTVAVNLRVVGLETYCSHVWAICIANTFIEVFGNVSSKQRG